jgi:hypothetical protein
MESCGIHPAEKQTGIRHVAGCLFFAPEPEASAVPSVTLIIPKQNQPDVLIDLPFSQLLPDERTDHQWPCAGSRFTPAALFISATFFKKPLDSYVTSWFML